MLTGAMSGQITLVPLCAPRSRGRRRVGREAVRQDERRLVRGCVRRLGDSAPIRHMLGATRALIGAIVDWWATRVRKCGQGQQNRTLVGSSVGWRP